MISGFHTLNLPSDWMMKMQTAISGLAHTGLSWVFAGMMKI